MQKFTLYISLLLSLFVSNQVFAASAKAKTVVCDAVIKAALVDGSNATVEVGQDPTTGITGIKFDDGQEIGTTQTYTLVLEGQWYAAPGTFSIKAGSGDQSVVTGTTLVPSKEPGSTSVTPVVGNEYLGEWSIELTGGPDYDPVSNTTTFVYTVKGTYYEPCTSKNKCGKDLSHFSLGLDDNPDDEVGICTTKDDKDNSSNGNSGNGGLQLSIEDNPAGGEPVTQIGGGEEIPLYPVVRNPAGKIIDVPKDEFTWEVTTPNCSFKDTEDDHYFVGKDVTLVGGQVGTAVLKVSHPTLGTKEVNIEVVPGGPSYVQLELEPGSGKLVESYSMTVEEELLLYPCLYDAAGNFISVIYTPQFEYLGGSQWGSQKRADGGVVFSSQTPCSSCRIGVHVDNFYYETGSITVYPGDPAEITVETSACDGDSQEIQELIAGSETPLYACIRDQYTNLVRIGSGGVWKIINGEPGTGDIVVNNDSALLKVYKQCGGCKASYEDNETPLVGETSPFDIVPAAPSNVVIEDAPDGTGAEVGQKTIVEGEQLPLYAVGRDPYGNFTGPVAANWSIDSGSGSFTDNPASTTNYSADQPTSSTIRADYPDLVSDTTGPIEVAIDPNKAHAAAISLSTQDPSHLVNDCVPVTTTLVDEQGSPIVAVGDTSVNLSGKADGGFFSDAYCSQALASDVLTVLDGQSSNLFYITKPTEGTSHLVAQGDGLNPGSLDVIFTLIAQNEDSPVVLSAAKEYTCILENGLVKCMGYNGKGVLGRGYVSANEVTPDYVKNADGTNFQASFVSKKGGKLHNCAINNSELYCWGYNYDGELGTGDRVDSLFPYKNPFLTNVTHVSVGQSHTCAVASGAAYCWGYNNYYQTGTTGNPITTPTVVSGLENGVKEVSAAVSFSCALKDDGTVWCWGNNLYGQFGSGLVNQGNGPTPVETLNADGTGPLQNVVHITTGDTHTCALKDDGTVWCWGIDAGGVPGDGLSQTRTGNAQPLPVQVKTDFEGTPLTDIKEITAFERHTCARDSNDAMWCWGVNGKYEMGIGSIYFARVAKKVKGMDAGVLNVAAGYQHTCAYLSDGAIKCAGLGSNYATGNPNYSGTKAAKIHDFVVGYEGDNTDPDKLVLDSPSSSQRLGACVPITAHQRSANGMDSVNSLVSVLDLSGEDLGGTSYVPQFYLDNSCTLATTSVPISSSTATFYMKADTELSGIKVTVRDTGGSLADGEFVMSVQVKPRGLTIGNGATCFIDDRDGLVKCAGNDSYSKISIAGDYSRVPSPMVADASYTPLAGVFELPVRFSDQNSVNINGDLYTFGKAKSTYPLRVPGLDALSSQADFNSTCVVSEGALYCKGTASYGSVKTQDYNEYVKVYPFDHGVRKVSGSTAYTLCTLLENGEVYCGWQNTQGQVGDGTTTLQRLNKRVLGEGGVGYLPAAKDIDVGLYTSCAVGQANGEVYCWGYNAHGELGDNSTTRSLSPVKVADSTGTPLTGIDSVSVGTYHACALQDTGKVFCWGRNDNGQIAQPSVLTQSTVAMEVTSLPGPASEIAAEYNNSCARLESGPIHCWGDNWYGQLGIAPNDTTDRYDASTPMSGF